MIQNGLPCNDSFDDEIFDRSHELRGVAPFSLQDAQDRAERLLVSLVSIRVFILLVILRQFVQRVISQMHVDVVHVTFRWLFVILSAEPGEG
jgi:hypothetical protein